MNQAESLESDLTWITVFDSAVEGENAENAENAETLKQLNASLRGEGQVFLIISARKSSSFDFFEPDCRGWECKRFRELKEQLLFFVNGLKQ